MIVNSIKYKSNIYIIEPSDVVYEGLSNILLKFGNHLNIYRLESYEELELITQLSETNVVILNPSCCIGSLKNFNTLKKNFPNFLWIAIIYNIFKDEILQQFDAVINIFDSVDKLVFTFNHLLNGIRNETHDEINQLSDREVEILKEMVKGLSNKDISDKLNISVHTVVSHSKNISRKTGIKSRSALAIYALTNKIISLEDF